MASTVSKAFTRAISSCVHSHVALIASAGDEAHLTRETTDYPSRPFVWPWGVVLDPQTGFFYNEEGRRLTWSDEALAATGPPLDDAALYERWCSIGQPNMYRRPDDQEHHDISEGDSERSKLQPCYAMKRNRLRLCDRRKCGYGTRRSRQQSRSSCLAGPAVWLSCATTIYRSYSRRLHTTAACVCH